MTTSELEATRLKIATLIADFEHELQKGNLRTRVLALIPVFHQLRHLGSSLIPAEGKNAARDRIIRYFQTYPVTVIKGDELMVVSGIQDWPRRVRELRVEFGWAIASGMTVKDMLADLDPADHMTELAGMRPSDYVLLSQKQDRDAAHRWHLANSLRGSNLSVRDRILAFFKESAGQPVTGEELRYVSGNKSDWPRRTRELRTEFGWPIVTKNTGQPDLPVGVYVLERDRQSPEHDRTIPDPVRGRVLQRDGYACKNCGWTHAAWNRSDPRHLELHHKKHHVVGGDNTEENLTTLCTLCHDDLHRQKAGGTVG